MPKQNPDGSWPEPKELRRIRKNFTEQKARAAFEQMKGRPPHSDQELEMWTEFVTLEAYNNGRDEA
jgi:hypothetical protein